MRNIYQNPNDPYEPKTMNQRDIELTQYFWAHHLVDRVQKYLVYYMRTQMNRSLKHRYLNTVLSC